MSYGVVRAGLPAREERIGVLIPSRMRLDNSWTDVCIRNISPHGLLIAAANPPPRGSYVEIRRGTQIIIARSIWAEGSLCGLRSQELLPVRQIIAEPGLTRRRPVDTVQAATMIAADRQRYERTICAASLAHRRHRSRQLSSILQFVTFGVIALGVSGWGATFVYRLLGAPVATIERSLLR